MLPAVVKLCCGISYPHLRSMTGLQRTAVAVIGQEISHMKPWTHIQHHLGKLAEPKTEVAVSEDHLFYIQQGKDALRKAVNMLEDREGWRVEIKESNGDVICSKVIPGAGKVFRLEAVLEASVDDLYDLLFIRVEDMHKWNPSVQHIKVLKRAGPETIVTHEVSAETTGNLIGQRDFLSVRHSCKQKSCVYLGGAAIQLESFPPQPRFVRAEDGPTCIVIKALDEDTTKCSFTWLLNMDVKGWLPKSIVNQGLPRAQLDFTKHLRKHLSLR
ncbi:steroidogenic acute regulatory protein, mitochondrial [Cyprinodon tularosa]|uniref:steroidogenic acute regulatory protein, mitochondrial-like n=1 Tax=Cyprinodon variegatus TaxID=28743 RepID=UPI000742C7FC|nr:PREDICTED: steroidogenic acute regulatory protein, mitochondrial-like [Cyprinodon variegatus]XP_038128744.1 steroidogenic acute regulatory protein, mitochondrial [Cyprinodon tularosa]